MSTFTVSRIYLLATLVIGIFLISQSYVNLGIGLMMCVSIYLIVEFIHDSIISLKKRFSKPKSENRWSQFEDWMKNE